MMNHWACLNCKAETLAMDAGEMRAHLRHTHGVRDACVVSHSLVALSCGCENAAVYRLEVAPEFATWPIVEVELWHYEETSPAVAFAELESHR